MDKYVSIENLQEYTTKVTAKYKSLFARRAFVSPQDYGAVGDGVTDDTAAFQSALDTGYDVYVPMANGQKYVISSTLRLTAHRQMVFGDTMERVYDETVSSTTKMGYIILTADTALFSAVGLMAVRFRNLTLRQGLYVSDGNYNYKGTAILVDATTLRDNADASIDGCTFYGFNICLNNYGRGTFFRNNSCFHFNIGYKQQYTYDGTGGYDVQQPAYGDRALVIEGCRFHIGNTVFVNADGLLYGARICNNLSDGGALFVDSLATSEGIKESLIANNVCPNWSKSIWMAIRGGIFNNNVVVNNIVSALDEKTTNNRFIHIVPTVTEFNDNIIKGNSVKNTMYDAMLIEAAEIQENVISENIFFNCCKTNSTVIAPIRFNKSVSDCSVVGNGLYLDDASTATCAVRFNNVTISGFIEVANMTNATDFNGGTWTNGAKANTLQS